MCSRPPIIPLAVTMVMSVRIVAANLEIDMNLELMTQAAILPLFDETWIQTRDGDIACYLLYSRHYSKYHYKDGRRSVRFVGPGQRIVLKTQDGKAMFVWRKFKDACIDQRTGLPQEGINCAIFRNEGKIRSSELILEAELFAWRRWPGERLYTYVNAEEVRSTNPGCCFKKVGWRTCGKTKKKQLLILEKLAIKIA